MVEDFISGADLDQPAHLHDGDAVGDFGDDAEIMGDEDDAGVVPGAKLQHQLEDLCLGGDIERGGRFVGDQHGRIKGKGGGDHHALALAAGKLVRIGMEDLLRIGELHFAEEVDDLLADFGPTQRRVDAERLGYLFTDPEDRVERGGRLLEDHRDAPAGYVPAGRLVEGQQVLALEHHLAGGLAEIAGQEPHGGERRQRLAGAGSPTMQRISPLLTESDRSSTAKGRSAPRAAARSDVRSKAARCS